MRLLLIACFLTLATGAMLSWTPYNYASNFGYFSGEEPFLTLRNIPVQTCVTECQLRNACMAVNYWRQRRDCELLMTDNGTLIQQNASRQGCIFIRKNEVLSLIDMSACAACNTTAVCNVTGLSCEIRECRMLRIENGVVNGNVFSVGARVKIVCNDFYILNPPQSQSVCQSNGSWDNVPTCIPSSACGLPPKVINARVDVYVNTYQMFYAIYVCNTGYNTSSSFNNTNLHCFSNGTLDAIRFQCLPECGTTPSVTNASIGPGDITVGAVRTYMCDAGYAENGTSSIICNQDLTWSLVQFECVVGCNEPPPVPNATVHPGTRIVGSIRNYKCNTGYVVNGTTTMITCAPALVWTPTQFECVIETCPLNWFQIGPSCYFYPNDIEAETDVFTANKRLNKTLAFPKLRTWNYHGQQKSEVLDTTALVCDFGDETTYCHSLLGYLVQLETAQEAVAFETYMFTNYILPEFWLGITDNGTEGTWRWMETNETATFFDWSSSEPGVGSTDNYALLKDNGSWLNRPWNQQWQPMCEKRLVSP